MKARSLWEPWATLIRVGAKRIETRKMKTLVRGTIAIHASKRVERLNLAGERYLREQYMEINYDKLPTGHIICVADLMGCIEVGGTFAYGMTSGVRIPPPVPELYFGDYAPGRFAWILDNVRALREPLPWKGTQGWFEVPDETILPLIEPRPIPYAFLNTERNNHVHDRR